jgi:hypothetical protein
MQYQAIAEVHFPWIKHNLVSIKDLWIAGDAPTFVANQPSTMLAGCLGMITVAVKDGSINKHQKSLRGDCLVVSPPWGNRPGPSSLTLRPKKVISCAQDHIAV